VHELSLSRAIIDVAARHAGGRRVAVVNLKVGRLRQVAPDTLTFYFELAGRGTVCEGARLEQELVPAMLRCTRCGHEWELETPAFRCPSCGSGDVVVDSGEELGVESIEVEEVECTAPG
jgi:hydrogenase nickel incorporation protein HypA/HybF